MIKCHSAHIWSLMLGGIEFKQLLQVFVLKLRNLILILALSKRNYCPLTRRGITWVPNSYLWLMFIMVRNNWGFLIPFLNLFLYHIKLLFKARNLVDQSFSAINRCPFHLSQGQFNIWPIFVEHLFRPRGNTLKVTSSCFFERVTFARVSSLWSLLLDLGLI
jgi:hypothetical protein